jgi:pSer/pThr/pTyr-binding forkhead associated (FHA) protein
MAFFLEIIEGSDVGARFRIGNGTKIGRTTGEILINDPKVSALHAQVEKDGRGQLLLVDRGSSNGLRINNQRVQRVALLPGVKFRIGRTTFKVVELFKDSSPQPAEETSEGTDWRSVLKAQIPRLPSQNHTSSVQILPFLPAIKLTFLEGPQAETSLLLGYGPRQFGADVLDIELQEASAPDLAFELIPEDGSILFKTKHPEQVLLNERSRPSDYIREGDRIRIGQSLIQISFEKVESPL